MRNGIFLNISLTFNPLFCKMIGLHRVPHDTMTFFALMTTFRTVRSLIGPSTPPALFLEVQTPLTPMAVF